MAYVPITCIVKENHDVTVYRPVDYGRRSEEGGKRFINEILFGILFIQIIFERDKYLLT